MCKSSYTITTQTNFRGHPRRMHHPNHLGGRTGIISVHDMTVGIGEGRRGVNGNAGEEGCHSSFSSTVTTGGAGCWPSLLVLYCWDWKSAGLKAMSGGIG